MLASVRARVTFVATAAVALVLIVAAFGIVRLVEGDLLTSAERALVAELELEAAAFEFDEEDLDDDDTDDDRGRKSERSFDVEDDDMLSLGAFRETEDGELIGGLFRDGKKLVELVIDTDGRLIEVYEPGSDRPIDDPKVLDLVSDLAFEALIVEGGDDDQREVLVGATARDEVDDSLEAVRGALLVMVPALVVLLGALIWWLVGRALRPVASITNEVAAISTASLDRRVPVPSGNDEISGLATVMNDMLARLERGDARQRQFAADASHELRSPLATVRMAGEFLERSVDPARQTELGDAIVAEADRMDALIGDLLELARIDESANAGNVPVVSLDSIVEEACQGRARVSIHVEGPIRVRGDERQIARALTNLVDNAVRHADDVVRVSARVVSSQASVVVEDDGPGIPESQREVVFERFARLDEARDRTSGGAGLGLALVRAIAARHGGSVAVDASPDLGGARFVLSVGPVVEGSTG